MQGNTPLKPFTAAPIKLVTQQRVSDEFLWASEDYRLGAMQDLIAPALGASIGRAVDLIAFHGVDPASGIKAAAANPNPIVAGKNVVEASGSPTNDLVAAVGKLTDAAPTDVPSGAAVTPAFNYAMATEVFPKGAPMAGLPMYPQADLSGVGTWRGLKLMQSSTVSGMPELGTDSGVKAIIGDWSKVRWGFQRNLPMSLIQYGDPDNTGRDLAGHNEVLVRVEAVIYVAVTKPEAFAVVKAAAPAPSSH